MLRALFLAFAVSLIAVFVVPATGAAQETWTRPSSGRRHFIEQARRERLRRQQWDAQEQEAQRDAQRRKHQTEDWIEQLRKETAPATSP